MKYFHDSEGKRWLLAINMGSAERVRAQLGCDLLSADRPVEALGRQDVPLSIAVWFDFGWAFKLAAAICEPQLIAAGLTIEQFAERLAGPQLVELRQALWDEWRDFFLTVGQTAAAQLLDTVTSLEQARWEKIVQVTDEVRKTLGELPGA